MNATKRLLTAAAIAAGALGIGAGAFFACRQELSPGAQDRSTGAERRPTRGDAKYDDGDYDLYFKNGAHIHADCDGYNSEPGGKTTIYEYYQSEINKWEKRLKSVGVNLEVYRTSHIDKYCWVRFDTDLLFGIGYINRGLNFVFNDEVDLMANGTRLNFKDMVHIQYVPAHERIDAAKFVSSEQADRQKNRDIPIILIVFDNIGVRDKAAHMLESLGVSIIERAIEGRRPCLIIDTSKVSWFAYNT